MADVPMTVTPLTEASTEGAVPVVTPAVEGRSEAAESSAPETAPMVAVAAESSAPSIPDKRPMSPARPLTPGTPEATEGDVKSIPRSVQDVAGSDPEDAEATDVEVIPSKKPIECD